MKIAMFAAALGATALGAIAAPPALAQSALKYSGSLGIETHYQDYREPSISVSETGYFVGGTAEGRIESDIWQLRGDIRYAVGSMDYTGSGRINDIDDTVFEGRLLVAVSLPFGDGGAHRAIPYIGYGYRYLLDELGGRTSTTGARGYDRISQYHYVPIGLEAVIAAAGGWTFKPTVEYDYFISGSQDSKLSQAVAGLGDLSNSQDSGYGLRASFMAGTKLGSVPVEFGPFLRYWNIDNSDIGPVSYNGVTVAGGYEPANETVEVGLAVKVWF